MEQVCILNFGKVLNNEFENLFQVAKIDNALAEYLNEERQEAQNFTSETGSLNPVYRKCPSCNLDMNLRRKKDNVGFYISCMGYPQCKVALWLPNTVQNVAIEETRCPSVIKTFRTFIKVILINLLHIVPVASSFTAVHF